MYKSTAFARNQDFNTDGKYEKKWHVVDANGKVLGRLCSEIAKILRGKNKAIFTPHVDTGDYVIVLNADKITLTGKKWKDKMYYRHTGYQGGLKTASAEDLKKKNPCLLIENAVKGMLPKNILGRQTIRKLKVYTGSKHPHAANNPEPLNLLPASAV